jgi:uncharacterized membrane protein YfhO
LFTIPSFNAYRHWKLSYNSSKINFNSPFSKTEKLYSEFSNEGMKFKQSGIEKYISVGRLKRNEELLPFILFDEGNEGGNKKMRTRS